jgi:hypothetical protein
MNLNDYKFRCSSLGEIITKSGKTTQTMLSYLQKVYVEETEGIRKDINSKYFEKGVFQEEDGISMLQNTLHKNSLVLKNKERKSNDFIQGECDCLVDGIVYDIKNAWDRFTFANAELTWNYEWQLKGYMWLWGVSKARLFYCLNNTPEHILLDEYKKLYYRHRFESDSDEEYVNMCFELKDAHTYDSKPLEERFKVWEVELTDEDIDRIKQSVNDAHSILAKMNYDRNAEIENNKKMMGV